ncbi:osmoprotectant NAGGN system M42 family peptidase [Roseibium suaedae]|uniref:Hydrolase, peptidase M42 family n=1 Tax=Roseibium suaedae TaxID=735517 RepID=A0A1M7KDY4_9HYPH|nr:osmoprotectant NAGGN system M42 family peptidase [Roseibium suaedae]SHM63422.1 hydrolase, peptidase M42 family [Roseibium suaedae]
MSLVAIDIAYLARVLQDILAIPSPTGYTDEIARHVCEELEQLGIEYELTRRGAIRARMKGHSPKAARAFVAHVDTLGAQVKFLKDNGRLELVPIGHWSSRFAEGARVTVFSEKGAYRGTILPLKASGHTFNDEVDTLPVSWRTVELRIDAYAKSAEDVKKLGIDIGDIVAVDPQPEFLDNGFIVSRHLDDKAGVAVMLATLKALIASGETPMVDIYWLFTIAEETGHGATSILPPDVASLVAIDNGTSAPGQASEEFGVTIAMADQTGPFDYHLSRKLAQLCRDHEIKHQKDVFRYYRSDAAAAVEAGADVRTALITFGIDASHGYERIHMHALRSLAELAAAYALSPLAITRDTRNFSGLKGFTHQQVEEAEQTLAPEVEEPEPEAEE